MTTRAACSTLHIETSRVQDPLNLPRSTGMRFDIQSFARDLYGMIGGGPGLNRRTVFKGTTRARGDIVISSASGAYTAVINGVTVSSHTAASDQGVANQIVTDINASTDPLVQNFVDASAEKANIALASVVYNSTIDICGYRFRAIGAAATAGTGEFSIAGTDTQDAAALAAAINAMPGLNELVFAVGSSANCIVYPYRPTTELFNKSITSPQATFTITAFAATPFVNITARRKSIFGNAITLSVTGTGLTASGARLTGGAEATSVAF